MPSALGRLEDDYFPKGVYIITTRSGQTLAGMTAAWVCRVAAKPPAMMAAISHRSRTGELIKESGVFVINLIDRDQVDLARRFGLTSGRRTDKFKGVETTASQTGPPVLAGAFGYMACRVMDRAEVGDHTVFFGEIIEEKLFKAGRALMFDRADYSKAGNKS